MAGVTVTFKLEAGYHYCFENLTISSEEERNNFYYSLSTLGKQQLSSSSFYNNHPCIDISLGTGDSEETVSITFYNIEKLTDLSGHKKNGRPLGKAIYYPYEDFYYEVEIGQSEDQGKVELAESTFEGMSNLKKATLRKINGTALPENLFKSCNSLEEVLLGDDVWESVTDLGARLLDQGKDETEKSLKYFGPEDPKKLSDSFSNYANEDGTIKNAIFIPPSVTNIGDYCFCGNKSINLIYFNNVEDINNSVISYCKNLQQIYFNKEPKFKNTDERSDAFNWGEEEKIGIYGKFSLENWCENVTNLRCLTQFFSKPFSLYLTEDEKDEEKVNYQQITFASFEKSEMKRINNGAFFNCSLLNSSNSSNSLIFPTTLETIEQCAFENSDLSGIELQFSVDENNNNNIKHIQDYAFKNCRGTFKSLILPGVIYLGKESFYNVKLGTDMELFINKDINSSSINFPFKNSIIQSVKLSCSVGVIPFLTGNPQDDWVVSLTVLGGVLTPKILSQRFQKNLTTLSLEGLEGLNSSFAEDSNCRLGYEFFQNVKDLTIPEQYVIYWKKRFLLKNVTITASKNKASYLSWKVGEGSFSNTLTTLIVEPEVNFNNDGVENYFKLSYIPILGIDSNLLTTVSGPPILYQYLTPSTEVGGIFKQLSTVSITGDAEITLEILNKLSELEEPSVSNYIETLIIENNNFSADISNYSSQVFKCLKKLSVNRKKFLNNNTNISKLFQLGENSEVIIPWDMLNLITVSSSVTISNLTIVGYEDYKEDQIASFENLPPVKTVEIKSPITEINGSINEEIGTLILPESLTKSTMVFAPSTITQLSYRGSLEQWQTINFYKASATPFYGWVGKSSGSAYYNYEKEDESSLFTEKKTLEKEDFSLDRDIGSYTYAYWTWLEKVNIQAAKSIGIGAFAYSGITDATIEGVMYNDIGKGILQGCNNLENITLNHIQSSNDTEEQYLYYYFQNSKELDSITLDTYFETLPTNTFNNINTKELIFNGNNLKTIETNALSSLTNLTSLTIPPSVENISSLSTTLNQLDSLTAPLSCFSNLSGYTNLKTIKINSIDFSDNETFSINWDDVGISSFILNKLTDENEEVIELPNNFSIEINNISNCPNLEILDLGGAGIVNFNILEENTTTIDTSTTPQLTILKFPKNTTFENSSIIPIKTLLGGTFEGPKSIFEASGWSSGNNWNILSFYGEDNDQLSATDGRYNLAVEGELTFLDFCPQDINQVTYEGTSFIINFSTNTNIPDSFMSNFIPQDGSIQLSVILKGNNITTIGSNAFANFKVAGASGLSFDFPSLTTIKANAFNNSIFASSKLNLPEKVGTLGVNAFSNSNLKEITVHTNEIGTAFTGLTKDTDGDKAQVIIIGEYSSLAPGSSVTYSTTDVIFKKDTGSTSNLFDEKKLYLNRCGDLIKNMFSGVTVTNVYTDDITALPEGVLSGLTFTNIYIKKETTQIHPNSNALQGNVYYEGGLDDWLKINFK